MWGPPGTPKKTHEFDLEGLKVDKSEVDFLETGLNIAVFRLKKDGFSGCNKSMISGSIRRGAFCSFRIGFQSLIVLQSVEVDLFLEVRSCKHVQAPPRSYFQQPREHEVPNPLQQKPNTGKDLGGPKNHVGPFILHGRANHGSFDGD